MLISNSPNVEQMFNVDFLFFLSNCLINMFNSFDDPYVRVGGLRVGERDIPASMPRASKCVSSCRQLQADALLPGCIDSLFEMKRNTCTGTRRLVDGGTWVQTWLQPGLD